MWSWAASAVEAEARRLDAAGALLLMAPTIIVFLALQRHFVKALLQGGQGMTPPTVTLPFPDPEVMMTESFRGAPADWWRSAVVYEIYPRSFADSDGDGIGDLLGARSRLRYLADLAVDAIWLTPFYPSPLIDGGYDVADYRDVDPRLGTLADFDSLVSEAHDLGIRVLVDIVPNHTSNQHPWFREACAAPPGHRARSRYHFHDGAGPDGDAPPSDWRSHFGGSAWERLPDGQWYLHLFSREQPDLNWDNPEVRQYFLDTLRFWADRGVDGFRVDAAHALVKDMSEPLRSQPTLDTALPLDGTDPPLRPRRPARGIPDVATGLRGIRPTARGRR